MLDNPNEQYFLVPYSPACSDPLPKSSITEWLRLDDPASATFDIVHLGDFVADSTSPTSATHFKRERIVTQAIIPPARGEKTNREWLENERAEHYAKSRNSGFQYVIVYSRTKTHGCLCKLTERYANRKKLYLSE